MIKLIQRSEWEGEFHKHVMGPDSRIKFTLAFVADPIVPRILRVAENRRNGADNILCLQIDEFRDIAERFGVSDKKLPMCIDIIGGRVVYAYTADEFDKYIGIGARDLPTLESTYTEVE